MSGRRSRTKGHSFERHIAKALRGLYPNARRGLQYRDGEEAPDVVGTPFHIECKRMKKVSWRPAWDQACSDSQSSGLPPVVVFKEDRGEEMVLLRFEDFMEVLDDNRAG